MIALNKTLILASNSPRRKQLLTESGFDFSVEVLPTDETYPADLPAEEVAAYIAKEKAEQFSGLRPDSIVLTADTVVIASNQILGKPSGYDDALRMLELLSGKSHTVITAVSMLCDDRIETVSDAAQVFFKKLEHSEISYYLDKYKPYDKAGAYGIQEWIGMTGIEKIEGSFYTIMGLPVHVVYRMLKPYFN